MKKQKEFTERDDYITGTYIGNRKGFGFVETEDADADYFIPPSKTNGALHLDEVLILPIARRRRGGGSTDEARVVKVLSHQLVEVVGTFEKCKDYGFVIPDNQKINRDIYIPAKHTKGAKNGQKVQAAITDYGTRYDNPTGEITGILGYIGEPGVDILSVVKGYEIPVAFPEEVLESLPLIPDTVTGNDYAGRADFRMLQTVTIDGEDAKDLDDAVTLEMDGDLYKLGVHIADVSHYVTEYSALDKEALNRGTSVYLVDRVIPMLPQKLSNGICSLNAGTDRLALSCVMWIDKTGKIVSHEICESVIHVDKRMSYTDVSKILEKHDAETCSRFAEFVPLFHRMLELSDILRNRRNERGSVDFDFPETKITLDKKGVPIEIAPYERNRAHLIIEDFMLAANETVAEDYYWQELPFVYRIHETPDKEKIEALSVMMQSFGYYFKAGKETLHPKELQKLLVKIAGSDEEAMLSRLTLRSMKQARYSPVCAGHFGLAANYYCHFTSPIRRYPDLQIHRIIKENLHGYLNEKRIRHYEKRLPMVTDDNSKKERRAEDAERDVEKLKKAQYMKRHIGEVYSGVISGVNAWGFYVELPNTVEGLVPIANLMDDIYYFAEDKYAMIGTNTGRTFTLGNRVRIRVEGVDMKKHTIDFALVSYEQEQEA